MKKIFLYSMMIVLSTGVSAVMMNCTKNTVSDKKETQHETYACPMHPEVKSNQPDKCPKCGMDLVKVELQDNKTTLKEEWTCPMHPEVKSDKAGQCPKCGMNLEKVKKQSSNDIQINDRITIGAEQQRLAGIAVQSVTKENVSQKIKATGILSIPENNQKIISANFNGRVEKVYQNQSGKFLTKGELLFEVYSSDLIKAQNDFLITQNMNMDFDKNSPQTRLKLLGITDEQITELKERGTVQTIMKYYSPYSGVIMNRNFKEGEYIREGAALYEIADISTLWNTAECYETNVEQIKIGQQVEIMIPSLANQMFYGKVILIYPIINEASRTVKVRIEMSNAQKKILPNMYTTTSINLHTEKLLVIDENAIIFTGNKNFVWMKKNDDVFELREVKVGFKYNEKYTILSGLAEGDKIAVSGGFFLDAERKLRGAM